MSKVSNETNEIYELLSQYKLTIVGDYNDYKCGICKNILINAYQATCACHFCYECLSKYIAGGSINCPNTTEKCSSESLSNFFPNPIFNEQISTLIVQCPNKMCSHECQLIEMKNHLNSCSKKVVQCPFNDVGCDHDDLSSDKLNDHMLSDIHNHSKIFIDLIGNFRNEILELKEKVINNQLEIEILKKNDLKKDEIIESLKEEMKLIKQENENLTQKMKISNQNLCGKLSEIDIKMEEKSNNDSIKSINNEIKWIKAEKEKLKEQIKLIERDIDGKYKVEIYTELCELKRKLNKNLENAKDQMKAENENYKMEVTNQIKQIDKYLNMRDDGQLEWQIGQVNQIEVMNSEYFYDKQNPYKMFLQLLNINNKLCILLCICSGAFDDDLKWPGQVDITINISELNNVSKYKSITKSCKIEKLKNSYEKNDMIVISHSDLTELKLFNINCKLWCSVKFV